MSANFYKLPPCGNPSLEREAAFHPMLLCLGWNKRPTIASPQDTFTRPRPSDRDDREASPEGCMALSHCLLSCPGTQSVWASAKNKGCVCGKQAVMDTLVYLETRVRPSPILQGAR